MNTKNTDQQKNTFENVKNVLWGKKLLVIVALLACGIFAATFFFTKDVRQTAKEKASSITTQINNTTMDSFSPTDNATAVGVFQEVKVTFDKPLDKKSQDLAYISLSPDAEGDQMWSDDGRTLVFKPTTPLLSEQTYTATVYLGETAHSWSFRTVSTENMSDADMAKAQAIADQNYREEEAKIDKAYPWLDKLPLQTSTYFVFFDVERTSFIGQLYTKKSQPEQVEAMKKEIVKKLKELNIPTDTYKFEWEITEE